MKLTLDPDDLRPECQDTPTSLTEFKHFKKEAQQAILAVGKATFFNWQQDSYNAIYPPEKQMASANWSVKWTEGPYGSTGLVSVDDPRIKVQILLTIQSPNGQSKWTPQLTVRQLLIGQEHDSRVSAKETAEAVLKELLRWKDDETASQPN